MTLTVMLVVSFLSLVAGRQKDNHVVHVLLVRIILNVKFNSHFSHSPLSQIFSAFERQWMRLWELECVCSIVVLLIFLIS